MAVVIDHEFAVPPEALWEILGTPDRVDWVPGVTSCDFDGEVRSLVLPGAGAIKERILKHDDAARVLEYSCLRARVLSSPTRLGSRLQRLILAAVFNGRQK